MEAFGLEGNFKIVESNCWSILATSLYRRRTVRALPGVAPEAMFGCQGCEQTLSSSALAGKHTLDRRRTLCG